MKSKSGNRQTLLAGLESSGQRLDLFLSGALPGVSRKMVKTALDAGMVFVDEQVQRRAGFLLQGGERIQVTLPCPKPKIVEHKLTELYRDEWLLAIDKPAGLPCHPTQPGRDDVLSLISARLSKEGHRQPPVLLHRLDVETSGVLLFALNGEGNRALSQQFAHRQMEKIYLAVASGQPPVEFTVHNRLREGRRGCMVGVEAPAGQEALTDFRVLARREGLALVEARPHTGRTHQIRVHLAEAGFPLLGDRLYGGPTGVSVNGRMLAVDRCLLHAARLNFRHPKDDRPVLLTAPLPEEFSPFGLSADL